MTSPTQPKQFFRGASRRTFLTTVAAGAVPALMPSAVSRLGAAAPSERIVMGLIGVGGQGTYHLRTLCGFPDVQIAAVCDVDANHRKRAVDHVRKTYEADTKRGQYRGCEAYGDFRAVVARPDIDAVLIAAPDHWHAAITLAALEHGKDVYVEKPLSLTVRQGRVIADAVQRTRRVLQVGSHERSRSNARFACELVRNGRLGTLHTIRVQMPVHEAQLNVPPVTVMPVPKALDWDMWLGPAPWAPYTAKRCHFWFRYILDTAGGEMTDRGAHILDLAQLANDSDDSGPVEIEGKGWRPGSGLFNSFMKYEFRMKYANGVELFGTDRGPRGIRYEGTDGWVFVHIHGGRLEADPPALLQETFGPNEVHLGRSPGHHQDFLQAVRTRGTPMAPVEVGHRTASVCHLTNIALLTGRKLHWDPAAEHVTNCEAANRMLHRPARAPWVL